MSFRLSRDGWIPWLFVGFFIGLAALEAGFISIAYRSFTGTVTDEPYAIGLDYNEIIAAHEADERLGWKLESRFSIAGPLAGTLDFTLRDKNGLPVAAEVTATAERMTRFPTIAPVDVTERAPGNYHADIALPVAGRWFLRLTIRRGDDHIQRIVDFELEP
ncbi:MAG: FixH family protein [Zavarzinia sp.]|nr:FixH family protein [Zavarzinia sp.]